MEKKIKEKSFRILGTFQSHTDGGVIKLKTNTGDMVMKGVDFLRVNDLKNIIKEVKQENKEDVSSAVRKERERLMERVTKTETLLKTSLDFITKLKSDDEAASKEKISLIDDFIKKIERGDV